MVCRVDCHRLTDLRGVDVKGDGMASKVVGRHAACEKRYVARRVSCSADGMSIRAFGGGKPKRARVSIRGRLWQKRRVGLVVGLLGVSLGIAGLSAQPARANTVSGVETVGVQMGWDQAVYSISGTVAAADNSRAVQLMLGAQQDVTDASELVAQVQKTLAADAVGLSQDGTRLIIVEAPC